MLFRSLKPQIIADFKLLPKALEQVKKDSRKIPVIEVPSEETVLDENPTEQMSLF